MIPLGGAQALLAALEISFDAAIDGIRRTAKSIQNLYGSGKRLAPHRDTRPAGTVLEDALLHINIREIRC